MRHASKVTIVGAGMAGLTAAFYLLRAGHEVVLFEERELIGGKFGGVLKDGVFHEHAYHFFADWCKNFWHLADHIGLKRDVDFERRDAVLFLRRPKGKPKASRYDFKTLKYVGAETYLWKNVLSGVLPWQDMILYMYSLLDLVDDAEVADQGRFLNWSTVNGFMRQRSYMTNLAALLHQEALMKVFADPSYLTSARGYQKYLQLLWPPSESNLTLRVLKGDSYHKFLRPFGEKLRSFNTGGRKRFHLRPSNVLKGIDVHRNSPIVEQIRVAGRLGGPEERIHVETLVLAIPPERLSALVQGNRRLWELTEKISPSLFDVSQLQTRQMASLDLYFKRKLRGMPPEHVTLIRDAEQQPGQSPAVPSSLSSKYDLSFIDNSQLWPRRIPNTFLNVVSSDFASLAKLREREARARLIQELHNYLEFDDKDIDQEKTFLQTHWDAPLFMNVVGSWRFRPETRLDDGDRHFPGRINEVVENLYLAGDYCRSAIDMPCVEAAIVTGLQAAAAICPSIRRDYPLELPKPPDRAAILEKKAMLEGWRDLASMSARPNPPPSRLAQLARLAE